MNTPLRRLVDGLAGVLECPVLVEDIDHVVVAAGHPAAVVPMRGAVARRSVRAAAWHATDPCRPDDVGLALPGEGPTAARRRSDDSPGIGVALHDHKGQPAGQLWVFVPAADFDEDVMSVIRPRLAELGRRTERVHRTVVRLHQLHTRDVRTLLLGARPLRLQAAEDLIEDQAFPTGRPVVALVLRPGDDGHAAQLELETTVELCLRRVRTSDPRRALHLARRDHGVLLVSTGDDPADSPMRWAQPLLVEATARWVEGGKRGTPPVIGIGGTQHGLADAAESYRQALQAASVATVLPRLGPIACWEDLGVYGALTALEPEHLAMIVPRAVTELHAADDGTLLDTLESFLDRAGQVKSTATALHLHRASLYQRLRRIEEVTGVDLADGEVRLQLHLGVKALRLLLSPQQRRTSQQARLPAPRHHPDLTLGRIIAGEDLTS